MNLRAKLRQLDWLGYAVVLLICITAVWPFLSRASLPLETDAELHIYRLAELSRLVWAGEFYPRWSPNFYFGYGYPIFNYYAPLGYYLALPFELLPGVDAVGAVKAVFVLSALAGGLGMYGFGRENWGRPAGWVATAVYVYAPYVLFIDPHARGVLAETVALGIFPLALWAFERLRRQVTAWRLFTAVLTMAALMLAHNLLAMVYAGILLAWLIWWLLRSTTHLPFTIHHSPFTILFAYLLGIGLSTFFWIPVALERNAVNLNTVVGEAGSHFDFRTHFLSLSELFAPSAWLDWGATEPVYLYNLGVAQWVLGGLGILFLLGRGWQFGRLSAEKRGAFWQAHLHQPLFFALAFTGLLFLMLPLSTPLWEAIPLLPFIQFPWRLLGPAVGMLAVLAGYAVNEQLAMSNEQRGGFVTHVGWVVPGVAVGMALMAGWPLTQVPPWPADFGDTSVARVAYLETRGRWLGTTSTADFVPATVDVVPERRGQLIGALFENESPDRINYWSVESVGATAVGEEISPLHFRYQINTPEDFIFRLYLFAFPGWQARLDGQVVETDVGRPDGFLVVPVPAGEHLLEVRFVNTPARWLGWGVTAVSLLLLLALMWRVRGEQSWPPPHFVWSEARGVVGVTAVLTIAFIFIEPTGWLRYESLTVAQPAQTQLDVNFGDQIRLIGLDPPRNIHAVQQGETVRLNLYWRAHQPLDINYQSFVHVLAADGQLVTQHDKLNPAEFPTTRWPLDKYVRDEYAFTLPLDLPPGEYRVVTGFWVATEGWRLPVWDALEQQIGDNYQLFELRVTSDER